MAYQNVGTPRFYVDELQWLRATGIGASVGSDDRLIKGNQQSLIGLDNNEITTWDLTGDSDWNQATIYLHLGASIASIFQAPKQYFAVLGHNLSMTSSLKIDEGDSDYSHWSNKEEIVNCPFNQPVTHDGFSIELLENTNDPNVDSIRWGCYDGVGEYNIRTISIGNIYDMPHSPDLNLKMSIEMDGIKNIKTRGGASLTGINYTKPQNWGDMGAWQLSSTLEDETQSLVPSNLRNGRRVWDLSFSYLSDTDVMPKVAATSNYDAGGYDVANPNENTLLDGTDFFSQVWNRTMGGHLPFIFQPDGNNNNPDQFAIARFDMKSLRYDQVAKNIYNVKLKIKESW